MTHLKKLEQEKELVKAISKISYYSVAQFQSDAKRYIKAIIDGRMNCRIIRVSSSGMSRVLKFTSCEKGKHGYAYMQYYCLFLALGFTKASNDDGFRINGCGMDMVFHTNYTIIGRLQRFGFLTKEEADKLQQKTPVCL